LIGDVEVGVEQVEQVLRERIASAAAAATTAAASSSSSSARW